MIDLIQCSQEQSWEHFFKKESTKEIRTYRENFDCLFQ